MHALRKSYDICISIEKPLFSANIKLQDLDKRGG
jgi:hypothetical protein